MPRPGPPRPSPAPASCWARCPRPDTRPSVRSCRGLPRAGERRSGCQRCLSCQQLMIGES
jgi:hypothetical protein